MVEPQCPESLGSLQSGLESSLSPDVLILAERAGQSGQAGRRKAPNGEGGLGCGQGCPHLPGCHPEGHGAGSSLSPSPSRLERGGREGRSGFAGAFSNPLCQRLRDPTRPYPSQPHDCIHVAPGPAKKGAGESPSPAPAGGRDLPRTAPGTVAAGGPAGRGEPRRPPPEWAALPSGPAGAGLAGPLRRKVRGLFKAGRAVCCPKGVTGGGIE